jgi:EF-P beta-lysylation protein EpmB
MINLSDTPLESEQWQRELAEAVCDPAELLRLLDLAPEDLPEAQLCPAQFPLRVPRYFVGLMRPGDPEDPLLVQVLPSLRERQPVEGFVVDPVGDMAACREGGILKKYHGRVLMVTTGACAVHCRYCFRRHFPYAEQSVLRQWTAALETLRNLDDTRELILSGGDPLTLSDRRLHQLLVAAEDLPQLQRLRIHSRLPVVLPRRITRGFVEMLSRGRLQPVLVIHANHPREVTIELGRALAPLAAAGVTLLNQSVLLKSVNDDADTLATLSESLHGIGVLPYYLHLLDPVEGAAHFELRTERARELYEQLRRRLPGYLLPRLVREMAGQPYKVPL